jgi:predicted PhzF superfamily epimerase YddE/YHI9
MSSAGLPNGPFCGTSAPPSRLRDSTPMSLRRPHSSATACYPKNVFDYLVEVESEAVVRALRPDFERLAALLPRGVIVTSRSADPAFDFVSRFFAPACGIPEDPVTGSAHCCLGPHWGGRQGKTDLVGHQVSGRGGIVRVEVRGDRVHLGGHAITIMRGELSA